MKTVLDATRTHGSKKSTEWVLVLECGHTETRKLSRGTHWVAPGPKVKCHTCETKLDS